MECVSSGIHLSSLSRLVSQEETTEESIDYNLLQQQERIFFFDDLVLFEDELADNGTAELRVKIVSDCCV